MTDAPWTIEELTGRVDAALAGGAYQGTPSGRVRDRPTTRTIRWYATIGLLDRPAAMRGRTAYYGVRHLLQLVAIKRRQAAGRTIAEIQAELAGAPDRVLAEIAEVPAELLDPGRPTDTPTPRSGARAATPDVRRSADGSAPTRPAGAFWSAPPPTATPPAGAVAAGAGSPRRDGTPRTDATAPGAGSPRPGSTPRAEPVASGDPLRRGQPPAALLSGVPLDDGAVLLLAAAPDHDDAAAIAAAARPLLDLLAARGLLPTPEREYDR